MRAMRATLELLEYTDTYICAQLRMFPSQFVILSLLYLNAPSHILFPSQAESGAISYLVDDFFAVIARLEASNSEPSTPPMVS
jgi:hypothetical protein